MRVARNLNVFLEPLGALHDAARRSLRRIELPTLCGIVAQVAIGDERRSEDDWKAPRGGHQRAQSHMAQKKIHPNILDI